VASPSLVVVSVKAESLIKEIKAYHYVAVKSGKDAIESATKAGELLWQLKENVKHGDFMAAVEQKCGIAQSTARLYMKASEALPRLTELLGKDSTIDISLTGVEKLANKHFPKSSKTSNRPKKPPQQVVSDPGPQKGPASVSQIEAQTTQVTRELAETPKEPEHVPAEEVLDQTDVGKKFKKLNALIGEMIRLCDDLKPHFPSREHDAIASSLDIASKELYEWRNKWRKMKVVS
jgi:hypothetical protein